MDKAERDSLMARLSQAEREQFHHLLREVVARVRTSRPAIAVRHLLASQGHTLSPTLSAALEAVAERDTMGPQVGTPAPDFCLKRLGTAEWVRLSSFQGQQPVALVFGSYT